MRGPVSLLVSSVSALLAAAARIKHSVRDRRLQTEHAGPEASTVFTLYSIVSILGCTGWPEHNVVE